MFSADHVHPKNKGNAKGIHWPISAKRTSFSTEIIGFFFSSFFLFSAVRKKAQNGTNGKKDTFFGLIFCFQKTEPVKNYFFAWSKSGAFGVILTMQLEPPKTGDCCRGIPVALRLRKTEGARWSLPAFLQLAPGCPEGPKKELAPREQHSGSLSYHESAVPGEWRCRRAQGRLGPGCSLAGMQPGCWSP